MPNAALVYWRGTEEATATKMSAYDPLAMAQRNMLRSGSCASGKRRPQSMASASPRSVSCRRRVRRQRAQGEEHPCNRDRRARSGRGSGLHRVWRVPDEKQHHHQQQQISHRSSSLPSILQSERSSPGSLVPTLVRASRAVLIKETRIVSKARGTSALPKPWCHSGSRPTDSACIERELPIGWCDRLRRPPQRRSSEAARISRRDWRD